MSGLLKNGTIKEGQYTEIGTMWDNTKNSIGTIGTMQGQYHCPTIYDKMSFAQNRSAVDL